MRGLFSKQSLDRDTNIGLKCFTKNRFFDLCIELQVQIKRTANGRGKIMALFGKFEACLC